MAKSKGKSKGEMKVVKEDDDRRKAIDLAVSNIEQQFGKGAIQTMNDDGAGLEIPCFSISEEMFGDAYAVSRTLKNLIAATPVGARQTGRKPLLKTILETELLARPLWA